MKHGSDEALRAGKHTFSCDSTQQGRRARMQFTLFVRAASHAWLDGAGAFFALIDSVEFCNRFYSGVSAGGRSALK